MEQAQAISATDGVVGKLEQKAEEETKTGQPVADTTTSSGRGTPAQGSSGDGEGQGEGEGGEEEEYEEEDEESEDVSLTIPLLLLYTKLPIGHRNHSGTCGSFTRFQVRILFLIFVQTS